ncbi:MAG TPA: DM13 domain-containing protein [Nitrososphaeraceae archaeon]|nr:DM13 domain-containing protein [Nitrososphaeraceae archaeon]
MNESNLKKTTIMIGVMIIASIVSSVMLVTTKSQISFAVLSNVQNFMNMTEEQRIQAAQNMTQNEKEMVMNEFSKQNSTVDENMSETAIPADTEPLMGNFVDVGDGFHKVEGVAKVIDLADGRTFLRLENLKATNGPDLYVYLSADKDASDIVNLGRLKGNIGNQNYEIPAGTDLSKYNTVLIWCKAFSTLFGSAKLST